MQCRSFFLKVVFFACFLFSPIFTPFAQGQSSDLDTTGVKEIGPEARLSIFDEWKYRQFRDNSEYVLDTVDNDALVLIKNFRELLSEQISLLIQRTEKALKKSDRSNMFIRFEKLRDLRWDRSIIQTLEPLPFARALKELMNLYFYQEGVKIEEVEITTQSADPVIKQLKIKMTFKSKYTLKLFINKFNRILNNERISQHALSVNPHNRVPLCSEKI